MGDDLCHSLHQSGSVAQAREVDEAVGAVPFHAHYRQLPSEVPSVIPRGDKRVNRSISECDSQSVSQSVSRVSASVSE